MIPRHPTTSPADIAADQQTAIAARDHGLDQVLEHNAAWSDQAEAFLEGWLADKPAGFDFIGEDFRVEALAAGLQAPKHHNAWGGFFSRIVRTGLVRNTGQLAAMRLTRSHARRSFVYEKL